MDRAVARVAARYPRTVKSNAWDVMEGMFAGNPDMFAPDQFHASTEGHLVFGLVARPLVDELDAIQKAYRSGVNR